MRRAKFLVAALAAVAVVGLVSVIGGCSRSTTKKPAAHHPLAILGGDGLEWSVLRPLLLAGKMPNLKALIERGVAGKLATFKPTFSPVIWTSIATGKSPPEHGILEFLDPTGVPYTSNARRGKALWNIASDYGIRTLCVGWWVTWPAEEIDGYMVAPYSAAGQNDQNWKGNLSATLENQTWPRELIRELVPIGEKYAPPPDPRKPAGEKLVATRARLFPKVGSGELPEAASALYGQTMWSAVADATYVDCATHLLAKMRGEKRPSDLTMVYLGGPDVSSHRFWKYRTPSEFKFTVPADEVALFDETIHRFYEEFDARIGEIVRELPPDTNVIVCSDHGFHGVFFDEPRSPFSGHHMDAPPGVFIGAGPDIVKKARSQAILDANSNEEIPHVGKVLEVAPLVMYLLGIPLASDLKLPTDGGLLINKVVVPEMLSKRPREFALYTHDDGFREPTRPLLVSGAASTDMKKWMESLGYVSGSGGDFQENNPTPPKDRAESTDGAGPPLDFATHIRPILEENCVECHGARKMKSELRLDQWSERIAGITTVEQRAVIVPGKPDESELIRRIELPADDAHHMPKARDPLPADRIALLRRWVTEGANWPKP